ncbi:meiosis regulator and mRNA stability factor 1 [Drosophila hydei]|uniref:Meiosis regulator and mRNA stability factor 1 n=1 Tax=Drosophila hydei TaxID=7224 RepID=A0A6J2SPS9_DROHY|nr:meiosis regulator and mRNA stability factor 1 [Drosophila hydei]XP_030079096.1 meiosis regulator and mRNA stability factor 1 [Drosophila hydei]
MTERLYSWSGDAGAENPAAAYYAAQSQLYPPAMPATALCADYNNNAGVGGLRYFNGLPGYTPPPGLLPHKYTGGPPMPGQLEVCQYAHANGSASCYNRNRYMPYNHNRACAAAAAMAAVTGHPLMTMAQSHQQQQQQQQGLGLGPGPAAYGGSYPPAFAPIYQQTTPLATPTSSGPSMTPIVSVATSSAAGAAATTADYGYGNGLINTMAPSIVPVACSGASTMSTNSCASSSNGESSGPTHAFASVTDPSDAVTLQITNLDYSLDETSLRNFLMNQLKPITPVVSLNFEASSYAKVTVPDLYFAKQVVSNLHRKKIGHKRMLVSYTRDSSLTEVNTLRCQVAGLLKDVPYYTLPMYKFRELFQSRFKTSISVLDLYKMQDICTINAGSNEDKFISLQPELVNTLESSPLMEGLQHSVPYCTIHFKREQHKGWAEQEIEPLPNVCMTIAEIQQLIYPLLKHHTGDIPVATLLHCIEGQLKVQIAANENGVNLEHLVCCVQGIQIQVNNFGIKILGWLELNKELSTGSSSSSSSSNVNLNGSERGNGNGGSSGYFKNSVADPLFQISREVIELVKMSPKSTMKFNRFIPAYHNHFGKQCRVADYGYTKLIELFEALSTVVQIMGDGENRQITLTHRTQIRRFTSDLLRVLRANGNNSVLLSQLPGIFAQTQNRNFDVTDYGVCDIVDILDGLVNSNIVVISTVQQGKDILISMPKRKQTNAELEKTSVFAGEMVELFQNALQYSITFQKFVRSYHYHFAYQCRLSDFGFVKLADLMDAIHGVVELELSSDEDKKIVLSPKVARRVFAEQCADLIRSVTGNSTNSMKLEQVLKLHKKKFGYQMLPQTLGATDIASAMELLPYVELVNKEQATWLICHNDDAEFRQLCYRACKQLLQREAMPKAVPAESTAAKPEPLTQAQFLSDFNAKHKVQLTESALHAMRHAIEVYVEADQPCVRLTAFMRFLASIVRLLEQRPSMYLYELKASLDCGLGSTFEYGFPNLYSVIVAHDDLFTINMGATQERSDVALNVNCELRLGSGATHQHLFGSLKLPYARHKAQRSARTPLGEHNRPPPAQAPPPHKTRAIANEYANSIGGGCNGAYKPQVSVNSFQAYQEQLAANSKCSPPSANSSVLSSTMLNSSLCSNCSNKENLLNSSQQFFHNSSSGSSSSSNSSFNTSCELNSSLCAADVTSSTAITQAVPYAQTGKLWYRRQASFYQQQQLQQQQQQRQRQQQHMSALLPHHLDSGRDLYDLNVAPFSSCYEPPKPDTPPSEKLPFWIDPIWSNQSQQPKQNLLNIRLPELKALNVMPMLLSPYTISKHVNMKRQMFNFDNHDRKIA